MMFDQRLIHAPGLDHRNLDLDGADRVTYLLEQTLRYDYPGRCSSCGTGWSSRCATCSLFPRAMYPGTC